MPGVLSNMALELLIVTSIKSRQRVKLSGMLVGGFCSLASDSRGLPRGNSRIFPAPTREMLIK